MGNQFNNSWKSPQRLALLRQLWADGYSASVIAARLSVSRNAVIGKVHRLGISQLAGKRDNRFTLRTPRVRKPVAEKLLRPILGRRAKVAMVLDSRPIGDLPDDLARTDLVTLADLPDNGCRFVIGEPRGACWCARPKVEGLPYCEAHVARAYVAVAPDKKPVATPEKVDA